MATEPGIAEIPRREMVVYQPHRMVSAWLIQLITSTTSNILTRSRGGVLLLHIPCNSFGSFFAIRILLGLAEACIVPSFLLILSMFFTYDEQAVLMPCMWAIGNSSPITSGLLSYGVLWINTGSFAPWKWFMGKLGILTCCSR